MKAKFQKGNEGFSTSESNTFFYNKTHENKLACSVVSRWTNQSWESLIQRNFIAAFFNSQIYFHNTSINLSGTTDKSFKDWWIHAQMVRYVNMKMQISFALL